jgi:hypothetical protein
MFSFILVPLYTDLLPKAVRESFNDFPYMIFINVILAYGMETSFFRFYNKERIRKVIETSVVTIFWSTIVFLFIALLSLHYQSGLILTHSMLDTPSGFCECFGYNLLFFSKLRATQGLCSMLSLK